MSTASLALSPFALPTVPTLFPLLAALRRAGRVALGVTLVALQSATLAAGLWLVLASPGLTDGPEAKLVSVHARAR